jgi:hypothetical protein
MNQFMQNIEFLSYMPIDSDPYGMLGIASVVVLGEFILRFKHVKKKDGTGTFFAAANYTVNEQEEKKYVSAITLNKVSNQELFYTWLRKNVNQVMANHSIQKPVAENASVFDQMPF